jgi:hypothetical protein
MTTITTIPHLGLITYLDLFKYFYVYTIVTLKCCYYLILWLIRNVITSVSI